jgi:hypothetical protein
MPTNQPGKLFTEEQKHQNEPVSDVIGRHILGILGRPTDPFRVLVRQLWTNHYRANVFIGLDMSSAKVAHSYFVVVDGEGGIVTADPPIIKRY